MPIERPRQGVIILDGPDAVGKTTLAKHLLDGDEDGYVHLTYDPKWDNPDKTLWRLQYFSLIKASIRLGNNKLTVIDRHWPSEQIYARVYRDGTNMDAETRGWDRVIQRLCGVYVLCAPEPDSAVKRHEQMSRERYEMYEPSPHIRAVAQRYHDWWWGNPKCSDNDYVSYLTRMGGMKERHDAVLYDLDFDAFSLAEVAGTIFDRMQSLQLTQYPPAVNHAKSNFLGHPRRAKFLFVGERINPNKSGQWPFIDYGASSGALSSVLHELNFDEREAMWTNAYPRHAGDEHVKTLTEWFPHLHVIAFGETASAYLEDLSIPFTQVVHPSYAKRFGKMELLREQLKMALG